MFQIFSDLTQCLRKEFDLSSSAPTVLASGLIGSWVTLDSAGQAKLTDSQTALPAWPIWNESYRDGSIGKWTPDVVNSKRVSVIVGKIFATTDQFSGNAPAIGNLLGVAAGGKLTVISGEGTYHAVAICVKAPYNVTYFGNVYSCIDIQTL